MGAYGFLYLLLFLAFGIIYGICSFTAWAFNYPNRKALNAQKVRSAALTSAITDLTLALIDDALTAVPGVSPERYQDFRELVRLYPIVSVLSAQGQVGPLQRDWLRHYLVSERYNLYQLEQLAVRREGCWEEWERLASLEDRPEDCGEIWYTLLELLCRTRRPDLLQPIVDALGAVTFRFHYLDYPADDRLPDVCFHRMLDAINSISEAGGIQATPNFHTFMLLQNRLAEQCGGAPEDWCPVAEGEGEAEGRPCLAYAVHKREDRSFAGHFLAAKVAGGSDKPDAIWRQTENGGWEVFYKDADV